MGETFFGFFRRIWLSALPLQLVRAICVAAIFELLVYLINGWVRRRLQPALLRDVEDAPAARVKRRRLLLGVPALLVRAVPSASSWDSAASRPGTIRHLSGIFVPEIISFSSSSEYSRSVSAMYVMRTAL